MQPLFFDFFWLKDDPFRLFRVLLWEANYGNQPHIPTRLAEWTVSFIIIYLLRETIKTLDMGEKRGHHGCPSRQPSADGDAQPSTGGDAANDVSSTNVSRESSNNSEGGLDVFLPKRPSILPDLYKGFLAVLYIYLAYPAFVYYRAWLSGEVTVYNFEKQVLFNGSYPSDRTLWTEERVVKSNLYGPTLTYGVLSMLVVYFTWFFVESKRDLKSLRYLIGGPSAALCAAVYKSIAAKPPSSTEEKKRDINAGLIYSIVAVALYYFQIPNQYLYVEAGYTNKLIPTIVASNPSLQYFSDASFGAYQVTVIFVFIWINSRSFSYDFLLNLLASVVLAGAAVLSLYRYPAIIASSYLALVQFIGGLYPDNVDAKITEREIQRNRKHPGRLIKGTEATVAIIAFLVIQLLSFFFFIKGVWWAMCSLPSHVNYFFTKYG